MYYYLMKSNDPATNIATEYYLFKKWDNDGFMLWRNSDCIVIGKNQNAYNELDIDFVNKNNINVVRRKSGGGAVFHDLGNINFTFVDKSSDNQAIDFDVFINPVISILSKFGIKAEKSGRNDILLDGKKISGNAQLNENNATLHHGTLMYSVTTSKLLQALNVDPMKIKTKGVSSVSSRVTNVIDHIEDKISVDEFLKQLEGEVFKLYPNIKQYELTKEDEFEIAKYKEELFGTKKWIYGNKYNYSFYNKKYIENVGLFEINIEVNKNNTVDDIKIQGDFFAFKDLQEFCDMFIGKEYDVESFTKILESINISDYFLNLSNSQMIKLMF